MPDVAGSPGGSQHGPGAESSDRAAGEQAEGRWTTRRPRGVLYQGALDLLANSAVRVAAPLCQPLLEARRHQEKRFAKLGAAQDSLQPLAKSEAISGQGLLQTPRITESGGGL